jgi:hypothetical protein
MQNFKPNTINRLDLFEATFADTATQQPFPHERHVRGYSVKGNAALPTRIQGIYLGLNFVHDNVVFCECSGVISKQALTD